MQKNILIITGETSADLLTSPVLRELKKIAPEVHLWGVGGKFMREAGCEIIFDIKDLSFMGFLDVFRRITTIGKLYKKINAELKERKPGIIIFVDFPGFNLSLAGKLRKTIKPSQRPLFIYYITPQIWAWGWKRIKKLKEYFDHLVPILPFEYLIFQKEGIKNVHYFGHPLLEIVKPSLKEAEFKSLYGIDGDFVVLMPGSRVSEVRHILSPMLESFNFLGEKMGLTGILIAAQNLPKDLFRSARKNEKIKIVDGPCYDALFYGKLAIVASGSATLECAIAGIPPIVVYRTDFLTHRIARTIVRIPHISLINIIAQKEIVPELIQGEATSQRITSTAYLMLSDEGILKNVKANLEFVKSRIGPSGAHLKIAEFLAGMLNEL